MFEELGSSIGEKWSRIWNDEIDEVKGKILRKIWKEKEKRRSEVKVTDEDREVQNCG